MPGKELGELLLRLEPSPGREFFPYPKILETRGLPATNPSIVSSGRVLP
jgi:hypothetical protein